MDIKNLFSLHIGEESHHKVKENIVSGISFRGANLWILACAILIASIGLNVNSAAVIIGAMLISPLMGPIVGIGFSLATYDIELLKRSAKNLVIATSVSLLVSCAYFYLSPFKEVQSELLARTSPTIYDVLIAFFGGLVGVISITRVEKGNPIPGVAIATALMPPLCTAGFGLSTLNFKFVAGALYLYMINCFFIAISTFIIIKYLKYKPLATANLSFDKRIRNTIYILILLMIVPSVYLAYTLLKEKEFNQKVEHFIKNEFQEHTILYKKISYHTKPKKVELVFLSNIVNEKELTLLNEKMKEQGINDTELIVKQNSARLKEEILSEISKNQSNISEKDIEINTLRATLATNKIGSHQLDKEIKILFPEISEIAFAYATDYARKDSVVTRPLVLYSAKNTIDKTKLENWLKIQLQNDTIMLIQKNEK